MIVSHMLNQSEALDRMFHALADPSRRRVVEQLSRGPATVSELAKPLKMSLPSVLQHLQVLQHGGLIKSEKLGRVRTCRLEPKAMTRAEQWMARQRALWESRLDRLDNYLEELNTKSSKEGDDA